MDDTQPTTLIGAWSRTFWRRVLFLRGSGAKEARLGALETRALNDGWVAVPMELTFAKARKEYGVNAGKDRPLGTRATFAAGLLNHCARVYSLEDTHQATIATIGRVLDEGAGSPALDVLRRAVRESSSTAMSELVRSKSWIASVTDRVTSASRPPSARLGPAGERSRSPHLWKLRNAPPYTFAGIYTALLTALGYRVNPRSMTLLAWDIAALTEGLGIAELSRDRTPGIRPRCIRGIPDDQQRRATDTDHHQWPLLGFLIMKLLEPHLASDRPGRTVSLDASDVFREAVRKHDSFVTERE